MLGNLIALSLSLGVIGLVASTRQTPETTPEPIRRPPGDALPLGSNVIVNLRGRAKLPEPYLSEAVSGALVRVTSLDSNGTTFAGTVRGLFADVSRPNENFMAVASPGFTLASLPIADVLAVNPVIPATTEPTPPEPRAEQPNSIGCTSVSSSIPQSALDRAAQLLALPPAAVTRANVEEMRVLANAIEGCGSALGPWELRDSWDKALRTRIIETAPGK